MPTSPGEGYPHQYESRIALKNGAGVFLRPILRTDGNLLVDLFNKMSPQALYSRFLRRLDALPEDMIYRFTHIDYVGDFALAAVIEEDGKDAIIAVGRYAYEPDDDITDLAVAVRDDWQHLGLGKALLARVVDIGKEHGILRFGSMMDPRNNVLRRILFELGYEMKYSLRSGFFQVEILV
ncbi:MAG: GNAT family N-acetyltransferase [Syntrophobacteraceae bacterium]